MEELNAGPLWLEPTPTAETAVSAAEALKDASKDQSVKMDLMKHLGGANRISLIPSPPSCMC